MPAARTGHPAAVVTHGIYDGANAGRHFYLPGLTTLVMACFEEFI